MVRSVSFFFGFFGFVVSFFFVFFCFFQVKLVEPDRTVPEGNHKDRNEYFSFSFAWISSVIIVIIHCIAKRNTFKLKNHRKGGGHSTSTRNGPRVQGPSLIDFRPLMNTPTLATALDFRSIKIPLENTLQGERNPRTTPRKTTSSVNRLDGFFLKIFSSMNQKKQISKMQPPAASAVGR